MCKCCDEIEFWKKSNQEEKERGICESKLFAKISIYTWRIGERKLKQNVNGTVTSKAYDLKYCPMCGKKII